MLAHVSGDEALREIFASGEDVHAATAAGIIGADPDAITPGERSKAKMVNYGIAYGLSAYGLADRLSIPQEEAASYIDRYFERFAGVKTVHRRDDRVGPGGGLGADADGSPPADPGAALAQLADPDARRAPRRQHGDPGDRGRHHQAGDDQLEAGARRRRAWRSRLILQIHDELLFEGPEPRRPTRSPTSPGARWSEAFPLDPPLAVDIGVGPDWLSAK